MKIDVMFAGLEFDALLAEKIMGWKRMRWCDYQKDDRETFTYGWHNDKGIIVENAEDTDDYYTPENAWSPSIEILAAYQILEKLKDNGVSITYNRHFALWYCEFWESKSIGEAMTLPMAICRAAWETVTE